MKALDRLAGRVKRLSNASNTMATIKLPHRQGAAVNSGVTGIARAVADFLAWPKR